jgi:hypothetical protein
MVDLLLRRLVLTKKKDVREQRMLWEVQVPMA